jgi:hypothetical protein
MRLRTNIIAASLSVVSLTGLSGLGCGSSGGGSGGGTCDTLANYTATVTSSSFATDVYPILSNTNGAQFGCGQTLICHGNPPMMLDSSGTTLVFTDPAATVLSNLMMMSTNAPTMPRVSPGNLANSMLAYKVSDKSVLACADSKCTGNTQSNHTTTCGDPMPSVGTITAAQRTTILDWIKLGAMP